MPKEKARCARCNDYAETINWEKDSSFWGSLGFGRTVISSWNVRIRSTYFRRGDGPGSSMLYSDETRDLCAKCWGEFVGQFMQGKPVPALNSAERIIGLPTS